MPTGAWFYWWRLGDVTYRIHQSVSRCLRVGADGLWGVIHIFFCFYCLRLYKGSILCTALFLLAVTFITSESFVQSWSVTCTRLPSPWRSSYGWCTSWWVGTQPQSPGWLTGPVGQQTPGCWRSLGYNLEGTTETHPHIRSQQLVTITFTVFRGLHKTEDIFWKFLGVFHCIREKRYKKHCCGSTLKYRFF